MEQSDYSRNQDPLFREFEMITKSSLTKLYEKDLYLFERNTGKGVCERCLVFRFAHYMQNEINLSYEDLFADCDFNSSYEISSQREREGKPIRDIDGKLTRRFVDLIIHKRDYNIYNDLICYEIKKWSNVSNISKDLNNLKVLTSDYGYKYGFHIIFGESKERTRWSIFKGGEAIINKERVFI